MPTIESAILSSFRAGILAIDMDGTVSYVNPIGAKILEGCPLAVGESIHGRAGENPFFRVLSEATTMSYLPARVEVGLAGKDGENRSVGFTLAELKEGERKTGICAFFKDLTHVEMTEESENINQRLLMLGQMAAGLAHEIRNPLSSIGVHCSILRSQVPQNGKLQASVGIIYREIEKIDYIIRECLNFVRPAELGIQPVRVDQIMGGVVGRLQSIHPEMEFSLQLPEGREIVAEADKGLLEQALTNILSNAVDACERKGRVEVSFGFSTHFSESVKLREPEDQLLPGGAGRTEEFLRIAIRDDGPGIPPEIQDKIFVPFFTTKKTGTGIGLPLAQKIVHSHGGVLDMSTRVGKGTEFIIKIPVRQKSGG